MAMSMTNLTGKGKIGRGCYEESGDGSERWYFSRRVTRD